MTMALRRGVVLLALCIFGCMASAAATPSAQEAMMVGTWYGEFAPRPGMPVQRFLYNRKADGSFTLVARLYAPGKPPTELRNSGLWGISNGLYFTVTTEVDGVRTDTRSPDTINPYLVQDLQQDAFSYRHVLSGNVFRVVRVPPDRSLPAQ
ncbi:hypothetical protein BH10PSE18_BH10PSE18_33320 [soil metagenome]